MSKRQQPDKQKEYNSKPSNIYGLNEQQRNFAEYYLESRNGSHAYELAYGRDMGVKLAENSAKANAHRLLKHEQVKLYIESRIKEMDIDRALTPNEILVELSKTALNRNAKDSDRLKAIELLGKSQSMWNDGATGNDMDIKVVLTNIKTENNELS